MSSNDFQQSTVKVCYKASHLPLPMKSSMAFNIKQKNCQMLVNHEAWQQRRHSCFQKVHGTMKVSLEFDAFIWVKERGHHQNIGESVWGRTAAHNCAYAECLY